MIRLHVPSPELWWPHALRDQPLYGLVVTLSDAATGEPLDRWERRVGFRIVELDTCADEGGSAFTLKVNGVPLFARRVNWIPDDALPSREPVGPRGLGLEGAARRRLLGPRLLPRPAAVHRRRDRPDPPGVTGWPVPTVRAAREALFCVNALPPAPHPGQAREA